MTILDSKCSRLKALLRNSYLSQVMLRWSRDACNVFPRIFWFGSPCSPKIEKVYSGELWKRLDLKIGPNNWYPKHHHLCRRLPPLPHFRNHPPSTHCSHCRCCYCCCHRCCRCCCQCCCCLCCLPFWYAGSCDSSERALSNGVSLYQAYLVFQIYAFKVAIWTQNKTHVSKLLFANLIWPSSIDL